jgi:hypothetical protein
MNIHRLGKLAFVVFGALTARASFSHRPLKCLTFAEENMWCYSLTQRRQATFVW